MNPGVKTALYAILDLCAKVGFGFILISSPVNHL
ncbi:bacteriorhodopsin [Nostoc sp.]